MLIQGLWQLPTCPFLDWSSYSLTLSSTLLNLHKRRDLYGCMLPSTWPCWSAGLSPSPVGLITSREWTTFSFLVLYKLFRLHYWQFRMLTCCKLRYFPRPSYFLFHWVLHLLFGLRDSIPLLSLHRKKVKGEKPKQAEHQRDLSFRQR